MSKTKAIQKLRSCPSCAARISFDELRVLVNALMKSRREVVGKALHPYAALAATYSKRISGACPHCGSSLSLDNVIQLGLGMTPTQRRSLRASINSSLRTTYNRAGRQRDEDAERCPCGDNTLHRAGLRLFDCCRKNGVKVDRPMMLIGRPPGTTEPRCPCDKATLKAAKRSDYKCCRKAGVVDDKGLVLQR